MVRSVPDRSAAAAPDHEDASDWESLYPADPDLMISSEGDAKGLDQLKEAARERRRLR